MTKNSSIKITSKKLNLQDCYDFVFDASCGGIALFVGTVRNKTQNKEVTLRKISENDGAIYYIGVFSVSSREIVKFKAQVKPQNSDAVINIKFDQEFFTD